ncbi:MAG: YdeI/OmpD-associated family protein [Bacteroidota bacterium]
MGKKNPGVDAYIAKAQPFAKPILRQLRRLVHRACPEVKETIKWGMPSFEYKGPFCGMASFKQHAVFGFWKHKLIKDPKGYLQERSAQGGEAMGNLGRISSIRDLPPDSVILGLLKQAKKLNDEGVKIARPQPKKKKPLNIPTYVIAALKKNTKALATFEGFSYSNKKDYVEWITEAKTEETRNNRLATAVEWMAQGKVRNWKYIKK